MRRKIMPSLIRLLVASAKGGVGKSTTALCVAAEYARMGKSVLLIDLDLTSRSLDMLSGCEDKSIFGFGDVINGIPFDNCLIHSAGEINGLDLLPASRENGVGGDRPNSVNVKNKLAEILECGKYDVIVCDTGGGISLAEVICPLFDTVLVTSEQSQTSLRAAEYAGMQLSLSGAKNIRLVVCAFDLPSVRRENRAGIIEMIDRSSLKCVGVVPMNKKLQKLQDSGRIPINTVTNAAYRNIARRLEGYDVPLFYGMRGLRKKLKAAL